MEISDPANSKVPLNAAHPKMLQASQITLIEQALQQIGEFGEVHLVVEKGRLRFIELVKSLDVLKVQDLS